MPDTRFSKTGFDGQASIAFLRRAFPQATANNVSAVTAIPASTIDKWLRGLSAPSSAHLGAMAAAFGPAFLAAAFPVAAPWLARQQVHHELAGAIDTLRGAIERAEKLAG